VKISQENDFLKEKQALEDKIVKLKTEIDDFKKIVRSCKSERDEVPQMNFRLFSADDVHQMITAVVSASPFERRSKRLAIIIPVEESEDFLEKVKAHIQSWAQDKFFPCSSYKGYSANIGIVLSLYAGRIIGNPGRWMNVLDSIKTLLVSIYLRDASNAVPC
jgi:hypothetical protein